MSDGSGGRGQAREGLMGPGQELGFWFVCDLKPPDDFSVEA